MTQPMPGKMFGRLRRLLQRTGPEGPRDVAPRDRAVRVFISYARVDRAFAQRLVAALQAHGIEVLIDQNDLPPAEAFKPQLLHFIRNSDTTVFIISPASLKSDFCAWELEQVRVCGKRLAPVVCEAVDDASIPKEILEITYVSFVGANEATFAERATGLIRALQVDSAWIKEHTHIGELAQRWDERARAQSALLRGRDLDEAEKWAARRPYSGPELTPIQRDFLTQSRIASTRRARVAVASMIAVLVIASAGGAVLYREHDDAVRQATAAKNAALVVAARDATEATERAALLREVIATDPKRVVGWSETASQILTQPLQLRSLLDGHADALRDASFSPDGRSAVTASVDNTARIWPLDDNSPPPTLLNGHQGPVWIAAFSRDGRHVVTGSDDATARVWSLETPANPVVLSGHSDHVRAAAFSPDGTRVATGSWDKTARIWRADGRGEPVKLEPQSGVITTIAFSPDGAHVVTGSVEGGAQVWNVDGHRERTLEHQGRVRSAEYDVTGSRILTGSDDTKARIWSVQGTARPIELDHGGAVLSATFSPDATRVATGSADGVARLWNAADGGFLCKLAVHQRALIATHFSPDGHILLTASVDGTAMLWDLVRGRSIVLRGHTDELRSAAFNRDGTRVVTSSVDKLARVWAVSEDPAVITLADPAAARETLSSCISARPGPDRVEEADSTPTFASVAFSADDKRIIARTAEAVYIWPADGAGSATVIKPGHGYINSAELSPDGRHVLLALADGSVRISAADSGMDEIVLTRLEQPVNTARYSADSQRVLTASEDGTARIWWLRGNTEPVIMRHLGAVKSASFSPDGKQVLTASSDGTARIWSTSGVELHVLHAPGKERVEHANWSRDGQQVVTISGRNIVQLWTSRGAAIARPEGLDRNVLTATFSADGTKVAAASRDRTASIWNADGSGSPIVLRGHTRSIVTAVFSQDNSLVATASSDTTVRLWNADGSGAPLVLSGHTGPVVSIAFSHDGRTLASGSGDATVRIWKTALEARASFWRAAFCHSPESRMRLLKESEPEAERNAERCRMLTRFCQEHAAGECAQRVASEFSG